jgi:hypothetical protein
MSVSPSDTDDLDEALNAAIIRIHAAAAGVPVGAPSAPMTLQMAQDWHDHLVGRVPIVSEDELSPLLTPARRAEEIAVMRTQLLGDLLAVLRRRQTGGSGQ